MRKEAAMPDSQDPRKTNEENRTFITEKIVKPPLTKGQIIIRGLAFCFLAVLFGLIAAIVFTAVQPVADRWMHPVEEPETTVSIPKDDPEETTMSETEEETASESEEETGEEETQPVEQIVHDAVQSYHFTVDDLNAMTANLRTLRATAEQSVVTVHSVQQETDWFNNPVEMTGQYAGVVIAGTETELLVMTPQAAVSQADEIKVTFANGVEVDGSMKQQDTLSGIAIVSVDTELLDESTIAVAQPLTLGNSYLVKEGDILIAVGAPAGIVYSSDYGVVSFVEKNRNMVDRSARVLYADIAADCGLGTFFINTAGEMVGWAMDDTPDGQNASKAQQIMGISDYKGILEDLSNGLGAACIGIQGQAVTDAMREEGMPSGIYVLNVVNDYPAYKAGIQNGDVITQINRHETVSGKEFQNIMDGLECGQLITVTVARSGREGYTELEFQATVAAR
jgi:S1-C subfamily serine protease